MPAVGSSISSRRGRLASAIASSTRLTSPYASTLVARSACAAMPTLASSASPRRGAAVAPAPEAAHPAGVREQRHLHVLDDGERGEGLGDLEGAGRRPGARSPRLQADQLDAAEPHRARVGRELAADHVEAGRLAAPFGPISASISPAGEREADAVDRADAAEGLQKAPVRPGALPLPLAGEGGPGEGRSAPPTRPSPRPSPRVAGRGSRVADEERFSPPATPAGTPAPARA
jgi:hypothetical protein